jgi:hypothetical protein
MSMRRHGADISPAVRTRVGDAVFIGTFQRLAAMLHGVAENLARIVHLDLMPTKTQ